MPSAVKAIFTADGSQAVRESERMVSIVNANTVKMANRLKSLNTLNAPIAESMLGGLPTDRPYRGSMGRGGLGGFFSRMGVAGSMFTSVARDSAASLASGAPISQVIAQQAPQVLQAFTFMGISLKLLGVYAAGAGIALLTMSKAAEAYAAKQEEKLTQSNLAFTTSSNRMRLLDLIEANKGRLVSTFGTSAPADLKHQIWQTIGMEDTQQRRDLEENVRSKLKEVILTKENKKNLDDIMEIGRKNRLESLSGAEKERAIAEDKYRRTKAEIAEKAKGLTNSADLVAVQYAYDQARLAYNQDIASIGEKSKPFQMQVTERERIGLGAASSIQVSLLDVNKQSLAVQKEVRDFLRRGGTDLGGSF